MKRKKDSKPYKALSIKRMIILALFYALILFLVNLILNYFFNYEEVSSNYFLKTTISSIMQALIFVVIFNYVNIQISKEEIKGKKL